VILETACEKFQYDRIELFGVIVHENVAGAFQHA
jgi:hypothetical protein